MIAIIADIHGNYPALTAVLNAVDRIGCKRIISLGDVAGYYCMINECIGALRERDIINIKGNHDHYLISGTFCPRSNSANRCLEYQNEIITAENKRWLEGAIERLDEQDVSFVHGGWIDPLDEYITQIDSAYFQNLSQKYYFSGHTHIQAQIAIGNKIYCNPGSVGQPRDGDHRAAFALLSEMGVQTMRVDYDIDNIAFKMKQAGFNSYYYANLYNGTKIGGGISRITF